MKWPGGFHQPSLALWPQNREATFLAARAARRGGDLEAARGYLGQAANLGCPSADIELESALIKAQSGQGADTEALLGKFLDTENDNAAEVIALLVPAYLARFRIVEADGFTAKWTTLRPESSKAWTYRADVLERLRKRTEAVEALRQLVIISPKDRRAKLNLARMLVETKQPLVEAVGLLESLIAAEPGDAASVIQLALCREAQGRLDDAVSLLDRVIAGPVPESKAFFYRGRLEMSRGGPRAAFPFLKRAVELDSSDVELAYSFFLCVQQTGQPPEIREAEERWKRAEADLKRVGELARTIAESPDDPNPRKEIGELFLRNGRTTDGVRWLESALAIDPNHGPTRRLLATTGHPK